ncbi:unnamed protein product [Dracunculus medinensis]|uniref:BRCT domain-containing protein n=1 Tax=Dracunculus medinensis TaxID=318479 RepID=A0A0N4UMX2_DRAME|nr:unnamed protein product [Dracunculus medinensis]
MLKSLKQCKEDRFMISDFWLSNCVYDYEEKLFFIKKRKEPIQPVHKSISLYKRNFFFFLFVLYRGFGLWLPFLRDSLEKWMSTGDTIIPLENNEFG